MDKLKFYQKKIYQLPAFTRNFMDVNIHTPVFWEIKYLCICDMDLCVRKYFPTKFFRLNFGARVRNFFPYEIF